MREGNKLDALTVAKLKEPGRYCDGRGLWLQVSNSGTKAWLFRYMLNGRARHMGLGSLHTFGLKEARERARQARQLLADGKDPIEAKRIAHSAQRSDENMPFKEAARKYIELHESEWRSARHRQQWSNTLRDYVYPSLGNRALSSIDGALITQTLAPIWTAKPETAKRVRQRIERVVQWVKDGMPLPMQGVSKRVQHREALPFAELPAFMAELGSIDETKARALEFTILTAARTAEALKATWDEVDLEAKLWTVPAERMKGGKQHCVPLSARAVQILATVPRDESGYLFPSPRGGRHLNEDSMQLLLKRLRPGLTVHGFRSSFRDWAGDRTAFPHEVIEFALAHGIPDQSRAAYRRYRALEKRRKLMEAWARYCQSPAARGEVVALHG